MPPTPVKTPGLGPQGLTVDDDDDDEDDDDESGDEDFESDEDEDFDRNFEKVQRTLDSAREELEALRRRHLAKKSGNR